MIRHGFAVSFHTLDEGYRSETIQDPRPDYLHRTPGKYERDLRYLTYKFVKSKFPVIEKLTNGALVTPTPALPSHGLYSLRITVMWRLEATVGVWICAIPLEILRLFRRNAG